MMTKERFENGTSYKMTYEEFQKCDCSNCNKKEICIHKDAYRRMPKIDGGLALCGNL